MAILEQLQQAEQSKHTLVQVSNLNYVMYVHPSIVSISCHLRENQYSQVSKYNAAAAMKNYI